LQDSELQLASSTHLDFRLIGTQSSLVKRLLVALWELYESLSSFIFETDNPKNIRQ
jgi:hypothetical protein